MWCNRYTCMVSSWWGSELKIGACHVCLSEHSSAWNNSAHTGHWIWYLRLFNKYVEKIQVLLKSDKNNRHFTRWIMYTRVNKNPSAWNFLSPKPEVTCGTVAIIIRVVLLSPYLRIRAISLSSIRYNQSHRVYINRRRQYICLTFKGRMLHICRAACIPWWPNVTYK